MRKYIFLVRLGILEMLAYRINIPIRALAYVFNIAFNLILWWSILRLGQTVFSWEIDDILSYYLALFIIIPITNSGTETAETIGTAINNGDIVKVLTKPVSPPLYYLAYCLSSRLKDFLTLAPLIIICFTVLGRPTDLLSMIIPILISVVWAFLIDHFLMATIGTSAFFTTQIIWMANFIRSLLNLFSGVRFPLTFFPALIYQLISVSPLFFLGFLPSALVAGKFSGDLFHSLFLGFMWIILLIAVHLVFWKKGLPNYDGVSQ